MPEQEISQRSPERANDGAAGAQAPPPESRRPSPWLWLGVGFLLIIALLVIFVLPVVVTEYELPLEPRAEISQLPIPPGALQNAEEPSPFEEALAARERQRAQDVLADILDVQAKLEALQVELWAGESFAAALESARAGDVFYRDREFDQANDSYQSAAATLQELLESVPSRLEETLAEGEAALTGDDPELAEARFNTALLLDPGNARARAGLERTANHAEFSALLESAAGLAQSGDLQQALAAYQQAAALDPANEQARAGAAAVSEQIRQGEFSAVMAAGFALLDGGDPEAAITEFERAEGLGVNNEQARGAIDQTRNQIASVEIARLRGGIEAAEQGEQWRDAVEAYDEVLAIDANVVFAQEGREYASRRALLDNLLTEAIANPFRFHEDPVYQQALDIYYTGRSIESPGPRLAGQLDELEALLANSQVPVEVRFASDNLTDVTVLRIAELGEFEQASLSLKPGRYVAVGRRVGYRDVREEFTVGFGQTPAQVTVQCVDRLGGRR